MVSPEGTSAAQLARRLPYGEYKMERLLVPDTDRTAEKYGTPGNYVNGANIAGFVKVANAMMDQGLV